MNIEELEKEATEFEENYTVYEVSQRKDGTEYAKKVCKITVKEAYLAGARSREKSIGELEQKLEQTEKDLADYQFNYPKIKELEKENAGLKARLNAINLLTPELEKLSKAKTQQLTKAKEIIIGLIPCCRNYPQENAEKIKQAEQFLKEIEK